MKYKVGDKVRIKSLDWYNENRNKINEVKCGVSIFIPAMTKHCGYIRTISKVFDVQKVYHLVEDNNLYTWTDEMIEGLVEEEISLDKAGQLTDFEYEGLAYTLPEGYIFKDENGNVINATKIVLEKKKKEYPKTYEECAKVLLDRASVRNDLGYKGELLVALQKLLVCRDTYWKIAGEEMWLGKPWTPNDSSGYCTYAILRHTGHIRKSRPYADSELLEFPTEEMRDAFYENFKELINECKELL